MHKSIEGLIEEKIDEAIILINGDKVHLLNDTAAFVWRFAANASYEEIASSIKAVLKQKNIVVDSAELETDITNCLQEMLKIGILETDN